MAVDSSSWLLQLLALWRPRVGMFLGDEEVRTLGTFLRGYATALTDAGDPAAIDAELLDDFTTFLHAKFGESHLSWESIIENRFQEAPELWPSEYRRSLSVTDGSAILFYSMFHEFLTDQGLQLPSRQSLDVGKIWQDEKAAPNALPNNGLQQTPPSRPLGRRS